MTKPKPKIFSFSIFKFVFLVFGLWSLVLSFAPPVFSANNLIPSYNDVPGFENFAFGNTDATIGDVFSEILKYVFILAGLAFFLYLILAGFQLMTSGGDPAGIQAAQGKILNAVIGLVVIFTSYWLVQIIETVFGMTIL